MPRKQELPFDARTASIILTDLHEKHSEEVYDGPITLLGLEKISGSSVLVGRGAKRGVVLFCGNSERNMDAVLGTLKGGLLNEFYLGLNTLQFSDEATWVYLPNKNSQKPLVISNCQYKVPSAPLNAIVMLLDPREAKGKAGIRNLEESVVLEELAGWGANPDAIAPILEHVISFGYKPRSIRESYQTAYTNISRYLQSQKLIPK